MGPHREGEGTFGDVPTLEVVILRSVHGTIGEIGLRRVFVDAVELGNVTLVARVMRETIKDNRGDSLTARNTLYGVLHAPTELQVTGRSILAQRLAPPIGDSKTIAE